MLTLILASLLAQNPQVVVQGRGIDGTLSWSVKGTLTTVIALPDGGSLAVSLPDSQLSAFGEMLTVQQTLPISLSWPANYINPDLVTVTTDAGTVTADGGKAILATQIANGYASFRSRQAARYVPGQGMSTRFTLVSSGCALGQQQTIGMGDDQDGFFFGCCPTCEADGGASFATLRRSNGVDNWTPASAWNGMWGKTPPDITKGRPYQIEFQWLGYGQITYSIEDTTSGNFVAAHAVKYAGTSTETSVANPTLPLSATARNFASAAPNVLQTPSMGVIRQGEDPDTGVRHSYTNFRAITTTEVPIISLRNNSTFNGKVNRVRLHLDFLSWSSSNNQDVILRLRYNALGTGQTYAATTANAVTSVAPDGTYTAASGVEMFSSNTQTQINSDIALRPYEIHLEPGDVMMVTAVATGNTNVRVGISWVEEF